MLWEHEAAGATPVTPIKEFTVGVLQEPCLVLNRNWQAVTFMPIQTCIVTVMRDMASVMDPENYYLMDFEEWCKQAPKGARWIKTASNAIPAPEVIVLKKYGERPPRKINFNRPNLYRRDDWTCQYCGEELPQRKLTVEHILPRSRGGPTTWDNCVAACSRCNGRKADKTPDEAGMRLRKEPHKPNWKVRLRAPQGILRPSWAPFLAKEGLQID